MFSSPNQHFQQQFASTFNKSVKSDAMSSGLTSPISLYIPNSRFPAQGNVYLDNAVGSNANSNSSIISSSSSLSSNGSVNGMNGSSLLLKSNSKNMQSYVSFKSPAFGLGDVDQKQPQQTHLNNSNVSNQGFSIFLQQHSTCAS
jgi:hypothetical protein